jgi:hypothetical protein
MRKNPVADIQFAKLYYPWKAAIHGSDARHAAM